MGKNKLKRFAELETMDRVFQPGTSMPTKPFEIKGRWREHVFKNDHPLVVELGCGRGEYTVHMAQMFPERNFIGIDKKGARLWRGAKTSNENSILNAAFLRIAIQHLDHYFAPGELSEIWITFPDPQPQKARENSRMTSSRFLEMYKVLLEPNGLVHLKTDNSGLFEYTLEKVQEHGCNLLESTADLYSSQPSDPVLNITTTYEKRFLEEGLTSKYLRFRF